MHDWLIIMSPVIPYSCEEYWHRYVKNTFVSGERLDINIEDRIDYNIIESEKYVENVISDIKEIYRVIKNQGENVLITVYGEKQIMFLKNV